ncbi:MAG: tripartite tricarboxylate transporter substrate binding protein [Betaproteobacteria bacterium]|nr:tripartite tricarboxylate transporter substrate binding protein [Betaproteobacteria bacterium]
MTGWFFIVTALTLLPMVLQAQTYPTRPIRIIVPFPPGAGTDIVGRAVAQSLIQAWKQSVVVDNRPGAGGTIAGELVARATPDGYTLMLGNVSTLAIARALNPKLSYEPLKDFAPITLITTSENVLVLHPSVPATTVKELIAYAKANPRKLNYGSSGNGTTSHLGGAMFASMTGIDMTHVPYKGSAPMLTDLLAGQLQLSFSSVPTALPHIKSGRLRALAVTLPARSSMLPDLPTVQEAAGLNGFEISLWQGIVAPAATPRAIVMKLNQQITASLRTPDLKDKLTAQGLDAVGNTPEQFAAYIRGEIDKWTKVVQATGARAE